MNFSLQMEWSIACMETTDKKAIAESFSHLLALLHQKFIQPVAFPLPPNHFGTLICLGNYGTQTITELSSRLKISKQQMSPIIDRLYKSGYISREKDNQDRRNVNITMTAEGFALLFDHHKKIVQLFEAKLMNLTDQAELAELAKSELTLQRLITKFF